MNKQLELKKKLPAIRPGLYPFLEQFIFSKSVWGSHFCFCSYLDSSYRGVKSFLAWQGTMSKAEILLSNRDDLYHRLTACWYFSTTIQCFIAKVHCRNRVKIKRTCRHSEACRLQLATNTEEQEKVCEETRRKLPSLNENICSCAIPQIVFFLKKHLHNTKAVRA